MPCYDPHPPWEGAQKKNTEEAARLLCGHVAALDRTKTPIPIELLMWYVEHRKIDLQIATTGYFGKKNSGDAELARRDIARARARIAAQGTKP